MREFCKINQVEMLRTDLDDITIKDVVHWAFPQLSVTNSNYLVILQSKVLPKNKMFVPCYRVFHSFVHFRFCPSIFHSKSRQGLIGYIEGGFRSAVVMATRLWRELERL